ncbi:mid1-interacting protein 1-B-like [Nerophis lumbriciformis]|uniref:mid1-interacting protein 1-B-like n=1 Tax=Nerophis lumbriciformis TaxID=546530 RepID=UPI002AE0201E|nr:mid1-interacting protein 1A-like [Nerophis lumbriciformis]
MQEARLRRDSLLLALNSYNSAAARMEQTVLLPSLLRDVPGGDEEPGGDLYGDYLMLKAVKSVVESGPVPPEDCKASEDETPEALPEPDADPESILRFHLSGLLSVMGQLTQRSQRLTQKYLDIIGIPL